MRKLHSASLSNKEGLLCSELQGPLGTARRPRGWGKIVSVRVRVRILFRCFCFALLRGDIEDVVAANEGITVLGLVHNEPTTNQSRAA